MPLHPQLCTYRGLSDDAHRTPYPGWLILRRGVDAISDSTGLLSYTGSSVTNLKNNKENDEHENVENDNDNNIQGIKDTESVSKRSSKTHKV